MMFALGFISGILVTIACLAFSIRLNAAKQVERLADTSFKKAEIVTADEGHNQAIIEDAIENNKELTFDDLR